MDPIILDQIEFNPSPGRLFKKLRIKKGSKHEELVRILIKESSPIARPKAMYTITGIDEINDTGVVLGGILMESRVMRVNLSEVHRVFPYLATSGKELYNWAQSKDDMLEKYYAEEVSQMALRTAGDTLLSLLKETYQLGKTASMNPGSLEDWPLTAQTSLFKLLGDPEQAIGVKLLKSMLMIPNQSVSGIRFVSESDYSNCELCPRGNCSHRRAPFDENLLKTKYK
ncbi:MAG: hypothetical protein MUO54_03415 [Anaerolineales bacterium]|nr:hypothetical protein [Anaerolineales bacterium]